MAGAVVLEESDESLASLLFGATNSGRCGCHSATHTVVTERFVVFVFV